ncbi:hypothetical protein TNIN_51611 [Trichonephila inaurata madagascariensis]|uniref:Uncharacterized protein n=1 Tax=Trichonephila inaurata madagascariensis TaxID=2747483 RepID=A0A8X6YQS3_9ARAC|nr:hypothetical protein TNIN_51611 [Trichonephila inaurata madagascariensis]
MMWKGLCYILTETGGASAKEGLIPSKQGTSSLPFITNLSPPLLPVKGTWDGTGVNFPSEYISWMGWSSDSKSMGVRKRREEGRSRKFGRFHSGTVLRLMKHGIKAQSKVFQEALPLRDFRIATNPV